MRRGEIAISVVIVIALGLLALISLATLLVSSGDQARQTTTACEDTYGGTCTTRTACIDQMNGRVVGAAGCNEHYTTNYGTEWRIQEFPTGGGVCCVN